MSWGISLTALAISSSFLFSAVPSFAESLKAEDYRVLSTKEIGLSLNSVDNLIKEGDAFFLKEDFASARKKFDKARDMSKLLLGFYSDLSSSFKGLDLRIPREMDSNSRKVLSSLSEANLRLASLFRKTNKSALAVPLLVEVVRISNPSSPKGQLAYQQLFELGFVNTPFLERDKRL